MGSRAGLDTEAKGKKRLPVSGIEPNRLVIQSIVRHYTDRSILAPLCAEHLPHPHIHHLTLILDFLPCLYVICCIHLSLLSFSLPPLCFEHLPHPHIHHLTLILDFLPCLYVICSIHLSSLLSLSLPPLCFELLPHHPHGHHLTLILVWLHLFITTVLSLLRLFTY
jgi:hypothetical protein